MTMIDVGTVVCFTHPSITLVELRSLCTGDSRYNPVRELGSRGFEVGISLPSSYGFLENEIEQLTGARPKFVNWRELVKHDFLLSAKPSDFPKRHFFGTIVRIGEKTMVVEDDHGEQHVAPFVPGAQAQDRAELMIVLGQTRVVSIRPRVS